MRNSTKRPLLGICDIERLVADSLTLKESTEHPAFPYVTLICTMSSRLYSELPSADPTLLGSLIKAKELIHSIEAALLLIKMS